MKTQRKKFVLFQLVYCWVLILILAACKEGLESKSVSLTEADITVCGTEYSGGMLNLDNPAPPNTNVSEQPEFDFFAWNTFIALNWPAVIPGDNNNQRGFPNVTDPTKSFVNAKAGDLTVWETFKEKREVFNHGGNNPGPWNSPLNYGPLRPANGGVFKPVGNGRILHQGSKMFFDSFDETAQVASESLEPMLPNGSPNPIYGRPVGPRVWRGLPSANNPILYEVKVNYDFYKYVRSNMYYVDNTDSINAVQLAADQADIALPYRTSAQGGPRQQQPSPNHDIKVNYSSEMVANAYKAVTGTTDILPPLIGSVHLKAAWIELSGEEVASGKYHVADAEYFVTDPTTGLPVSRNGSFGLVGLHIIQRVHTGKEGDQSSEPKGGTFIFATWEHVGNDAAGFTYSNYYDPDTDPNKPTPVTTAQFIPALTDPFQVVRKFPVISQEAPKPLGTQQVNEAVHQAIAARNPNSVWLNYRLIGTQFVAINTSDAPVNPNPNYPVNENDPTGIGQQVFLANLVIETNEGLQHFMGLPPLTYPIDNYKGNGLAPNTQFVFDRNAKNTSFSGGAHNMGGCMGCHGVAQSKGFSFSFVLLGGFKGAKTDTQSDFEIPPPPINGN